MKVWPTLARYCYLKGFTHSYTRHRISHLEYIWFINNFDYDYISFLIWYWKNSSSFAGYCLWHTTWGTHSASHLPHNMSQCNLNVSSCFYIETHHRHPIFMSILIHHLISIKYEFPVLRKYMGIFLNLQYMSWSPI